MKKTVLEEVLERSQNFEASLKTLAYSMEAMNDIDNGEKELREIGWNIASQIECLQEYHAKTLRLVEQLKSDQGGAGAEEQTETEIKGKMLTKAEAVALFKKNSILLNPDQDVISFSKVIDIFGKEAAILLADSILNDPDYIEMGVDMGGCGINVDYLYESGFLKVAANHNTILQEKNDKKSESGRFWVRYMNEREKQKVALSRGKRSDTP